MANKKTDIVLATRNSGKIRELGDLLADSGVNVLGLDSFPQIGEIEENGSTFAENALIKARAAAKATGLISIADDSGLVVDALGDRPGVYSARYGDDWEYLPDETRDQRNMRKLLHEMGNIANRACHFETAMAAVSPDGHELVARGIWHGTLLDAPCGHNGFGYDPVFHDPELGRSAATLSREEKNSRSHRGNALRALLAQWPAFLKSVQI